MTKIKKCEARKNVIVTFPNGICYEAEKGTAILDYIKEYSPDYKKYLAVKIKNRLRALSYIPNTDVEIEPLEFNDPLAKEVYCRSLVFIMIAAISELFPTLEIQVSSSIPDGGYFCMVINRDTFSSDELHNIKIRMKELIDADLPITNVPLDQPQLKELFIKRNEYDKEELINRFKTKNQEYILKKLNNRIDIVLGHLVPSTGFISAFDLYKLHDGFVLQFPNGDDPNILSKHTKSNKIIKVFYQYRNWLNLLNLGDAGKINKCIATGKIKDVILASEALQQKSLVELSEQIFLNKDKTKIITIAGPSSSGKTTFSKRLAIQLLARGLSPFTLELDNYFVNRELTPRDEDGNYNFEDLEAIDLKLLNQHIRQLLDGQKVRLPKFNFKVGKREQGPYFQLCPNQIIIAEGIHGLNPRLFEQVSKDKIFRIYISALSQINFDRHNRIPTTDIRLLRRIIRDAKHRGYSAEETIMRWTSVRAGEQKNIFPFQENADSMFNSALVYEINMLKKIAMPLLLQISTSSPAYIKAYKLLAMLSMFDEISTELVPHDSILREFVGNSILDDYLPGHIK